MSDKIVKVGSKVKFSSDGGHLVGDITTVKGKVHTIIALNVPYRSKGDCNATLDNGNRIRLSTIDGSGQKNMYENMFTVVEENVYEIY